MSLSKHRLYIKTTKRVLPVLPLTHKQGNKILEKGPL
jgi:hypothetical protein